MNLLSWKMQILSSLFRSLVGWSGSRKLGKIGEPDRTFFTTSFLILIAGRRVATTSPGTIISLSFLGSFKAFSKS